MNLITKHPLYKTRLALPVPNICPFCNHDIVPSVQNESHYFQDNVALMYLSLFCPACKNAWVNKYDLSWGEPQLVSANKRFKRPEEITSNIVKVSPVGAETLTQALQAEQDGYDQLVGIGIRKAIEFLLKDFYSFKLPDDSSKIKRMYLGDLINTYITDKDLYTLAKATTWLANDETHYVRKHTDKDLQTLKRFTKGLLKNIEYQIALLDARDFLNH